ncbi:MAG: asparagine synthase (glutamine-hydrolyzing), partial [Pseudomonadales bacterium]|nr:asparagine synthase (glutamine-hydrolyzing) [Pseudomonadales bacterium]
LAGIVKIPGQQPQANTLERMGRALAHRGPDSNGHWIGNNVGFAHQRLSIIDLSKEGHQPMLSSNGRYALVFNGEIFNFETLRQETSITDYHGHSDTEVLLQALIEWGVERAVSKLVGMFAFAFYDRQAQSLWLVRDRLGIKPLYYGWQDGSLIFASELGAIEAASSHRPEVSKDAIALMMRHNHVPAPYCIYENFNKLTPASILKVDTSIAPSPSACSKTLFWSPQKAINTPLSMPDEQWRQAFQNQLRDAVKTRLVSDVPLGGFLSGGIDSTLIVALMQEQSERRVSTYTIGFEDDGFNEAEHAKLTALHLGTDHHELYLNEQSVLDAVAQLPKLCDEPFADQSILPTYLLCNMAKQDVTVALSGDGGDEILWGYSRYPTRERLDQLRSRIPALMRPLASSALSSKLLQRTVGALPTPSMLGRSSRIADKMQMSAQMLSMDDENEFYRFLMSHWKTPTALIRGSKELPTHYSDPPDWTLNLPVWRRMSALDLIAYLPDDCLTKVDRASMAVSLEVRVPLLDHRVVEMAYQLPEHLVRRDGIGKIILRDMLDEYVPRAMMDRPKSGFGVPLGNWLKGPLKDWAYDLLSGENLARQEFFNIQMVTELHTQHQAGNADWSAYLWDVLMFLNWDRSRETAGR